MSLYVGSQRVAPIVTVGGGAVDDVEVNGTSVVSGGVASITTAGVLPSQSGNSGKFLTTDGSAASWADVDSLPSQTGQSGKYLTTNGTTASWGAVDALPAQSGQSGKYLTTNGTAASWSEVDSFPSQSGNSGKFLTTDGTDVSWADVDSLPSQTGQSGKFLTTNGAAASWSEVPAELPSQTGNAGKVLTTDGTVASWGEQFSRQIGEIVASTLPLTDAGLHLLDGALIDGNGIYSDFVDYIADLYADNPNASYFCQGESLQPWTQPVLTSNGTMGGSSYACDASSYESDFYAWKAFDNDTSTRWGSSSDAFPDWITFYSPVPLRVSNVYLHFYVSTEVYSAGEIQGSNDNSTWTTLASFNNNSSLELNVSINTNVSYKYIRFYGTATVGSPWGKISKFQITAQQGQEATAEEQWQTSVTTYGVCGKFVYNSTNNTVRLPKITGILEGTTDVTALGDLVEAGLPNITGNLGNSWIDGNVTDGCFVGTNNGNYRAGAGSYDGKYKINFDASRSSSIYGNSSTVQPQTIKAFYYIVVATSTKTDIQVDIDEIATDLNSKVDKADLQEVQCVVETYQNGSSWYRVYSDGWCEQGGHFDKGSLAKDTTNTITLLKPFVNINYTLIALANRNDNSTGSINNQVFVVYRTTNSFLARCYGDGNSQYIDWQACGYIEV